MVINRMAKDYLASTDNELFVEAVSMKEEKIDMEYMNDTSIIYSHTYKSLIAEYLPIFQQLNPQEQALVDALDLPQYASIAINEIGIIKTNEKIIFQLNGYIIFQDDKPVVYFLADYKTGIKLLEQATWSKTCRIWWEKPDGEIFHLK